MRFLSFARNLWISALAGPLALFVAPLQAADTKFEEVEIGQAGGQGLHVMLIPPDHPAPGPLPVVLFIHGGGWNGTHKNPGDLGWVHAFMNMTGFYGLSVEYRLANNAKWPAQLDDCRAAIRWVRANAAKYGLDPRHIAVWGISAGGHLVSCLGTMNDDPAERVQAVVDMCGPTDLVSRGESDSVANLFGGKLAEKPEVWKSGDPIEHVKPGLPPFFVLHGDKDPVVAYDESVRFVAALKAAGVPVEFVTIKNGNHGFKPVDPTLPVEPSMDVVTRQIVEFLQRELKR